MSSISIDQPVPDFDIEATNGNTMRLSVLKGRNVVLYFYPKDNTPGCTSQAQQFRDASAAFGSLNTVILGVSRDSLRSHETFRAKHALPFELVSDPQEALCRLFDVIKMKKLYGKESPGVERSTFLIDRNGVLRREWRKVKVKDHVEEVLAAVRELQS